VNASPQVSIGGNGGDAGNGGAASITNSVSNAVGGLSGN